MLDPKKLKLDFPIFKRQINGKDITYLDSASTSQKPQQVINAIVDFYTKYNSNVHRGIYTLSEEATSLYEGVREKIAKFLGANDTSEIIFTGNTNEAINLVAEGWVKKNLKSGDIIVLSEMEHHANIVPYLRLKEELGVEIFFVPMDEDYRLDYKKTLNLDTSKIKFIALTHASNVLGTINPIKEIISFFKQNNIDAKILIDGAQSVPHFKVDVKDLGCDFYAFSSHKVLGPSGVGVLWGKKELLEETDPLFVGSQMISKVSKDKVSYSEIPFKFEVGTGKLEGVVGLGSAIEYINNVGLDQINEHEREIVEYGLKKLLEVKGLTLYGPKTKGNRLAIFSFNLEGIHAHDVAQILDREGICVRSGHHCAQVLMDVCRVPATARASFYLYNNKEDVDKLIEGLEKVREIFK